MNTFAKNLQFLLDKHDLKPARLAREIAVSQPTLQRILAGTRSAGIRTIDSVAKYFDIEVNNLRFKDLSENEADFKTLPHIRSPQAMVRIQALAGFELPSSGPLSRLEAFPYLDASFTWFQANIGPLPSQIRLAVMRDDTMKGEIEAGDVVFVDTSVTDIEKAGEGIYAFTYFGIHHIKYGQVIKPGKWLFKGTKAFLDSMPVEGNEAEGLVIFGRVVARLRVDKL